MHKEIINERINTRQGYISKEQAVYGMDCSCDNGCDNDGCACKSGKVCQCGSNTDDDVWKPVSTGRILFWV